MERFDQDRREQPLRVFYSYSRVDAKQRLRLSKHLAPLERIGLIRCWHDHEIPPGAEWEQEISDKLDEADIIVLLISPDFVASKHCYEIELQRAMERRKQRSADVLPIIIRETNAWQIVPAGRMQLGDLNALPSSGKPIPEWKRQDAGWANVAAGVQRVAEQLRTRRESRSGRTGRTSR